MFSPQINIIPNDSSTDNNSFKFQDIKKNLDTNTNEEKDENFDKTTSFDNDLHPYVFYNQLSDNYTNFLKINDSKLNDVALSSETNPEQDFQDTFIVNHQYKFDKPLLLQSNYNKTTFDKTNYIYFKGMPLLYPMVKIIPEQLQQKMIKDLKNNESVTINNLVLKQVTKELLTKNNVSLNNSNFANFIKKFLYKSLDNNKFNPEVTISNFYGQENSQFKYKKDYDIQQMDKTKNHLDEFFTEEVYHDPSFELIPRTKATRGKRLINNSIKINQDFIEFKRQELDHNIKESIGQSIYCNGFLKFPSYDQKLAFIKSNTYVFGVHLQDKIVSFYDSDFCNMLKVGLNSLGHLSSKLDLINKANEFTYFGNSDAKEIKINQLVNLLNFNLKSGNFSGSLLEKPVYTDKSLVIDEVKVGDFFYIRTNSFLNSLEILEALNNDDISKMLTINLLVPEVNYYNEHFISGMDLVLQNTVKGFNSLLAVKSNYDV